MMTIGGTAHILMLLASILIVATLMIIVTRVSYKAQCAIIYSAVILCMLGILFLHLTHYGTTLDFKNFFVQMFQVCNFNFILLPLCLIKKNELGRVLHIPSEVPEYKNIEEKYYEEEELLRQYMEDCKNEALELFSKWFYSLWD